MSEREECDMVPVDGVIEIIQSALRGDSRYRTKDGYTKWGLVEQDIRTLPTPKDQP